MARRHWMSSRRCQSDLFGPTRGWKVCPEIVQPGAFAMPATACAHSRAACRESVDHSGFTWTTSLKVFRLSLPMSHAATGLAGSNSLETFGH